MRQPRRARHAVIVGAGIGGLATAIGLRRSGWLVTVLEQAPRLEAVGSGIALWPNGLRALEAMGLAEAVRSISSTEAGTRIRHPSGRWLSRGDTATARLGPVLLLERGDLLAVLLNAVPRDMVRVGARVDTITGAGTGTGAVRVSYPGGHAEGDLVVGADGVHSTIRASLFPTHPGPRYAGYTAWRMVVPALAAGADPGPAGETWGRGQRFGLAPLPDGRTYCYATALTPPGQRAGDRNGEPGELVELRRRFNGWHRPIPMLLAAASPDAILRTDVHELATPLPSYCDGQVALLGDAAHAMTPDLGQGGCQALEDAVTLAVSLAAEPHLPAALARYDRARRRRTQAVVRYTGRIGRVAHLRSWPATRLRDALLAHLAPAAGSRSLRRILDWTPPAWPPPGEASS